jgi:hypothetical protein
MLAPPLLRAPLLPVLLLLRACSQATLKRGGSRDAARKIFADFTTYIRGETPLKTAVQSKITLGRARTGGI